MKTSAFRPSNHIAIARRGFTLVELLTVIAIIGILAAIIIPVVGSVRKKAHMATSRSNLRQLGAAAQIFIADNKGNLPVAATALNDNYFWIQQLWKILYSGRGDAPDFSTSDTYDNYLKKWGGTVFHSPMVEKRDGCCSYGYNAMLRVLQPSPPHSPLRIEQIINPSRTAMIADSPESINLFAYEAAKVTKYNRNDGKVFCVFVDGHVDALLPPVQGVNFPPVGSKQMPYDHNNSMFWRGIGNSGSTTLVPW
ncbi:type II secretion system protein [Geminisphaera colitermitum]|uniref:type II secretion system protein n=1 Tax=Geminisphaera colitermitum TaxID=1148786 RepID=UPI000158D5C2|nr:prepilin-type N-terminal cleavage/methylation domain-containing protein [Geminisphaera colitermitum]